MASEEIGSAYLTVKPKMSDGFGSELEGAGGKSGHGFGNAFSVAAGNLISGAVEKLGTAVADTFKTAFDNYANYEQLVGGVDTLFKESSSIVQENAARAFKSAGMSANEYMENVTSFSASLLQSLGGDTKKAADYADRAMVDMSDNANKMGTDMDRITDAYQGFAKDNYTMLDNLKLGYGGTKTEMQRLISDAAKMTDVQKELGVTVDGSSMSFGNVVNAISVMQKSMGIAGTTAKEGSETISGAIGKLEASWQNFLTGIFDDNADMSALGEQLFESIGDVVRNVAPRIMTLVQRVIFELPGALVSALQSLPEMIQPAIEQVFGEQMGGKINEALGGAFAETGELFQQLYDAVMPLIESIVELATPIAETALNIATTVLPLLQEALGIVIGFVTENVIPTVTEVIETITPAVETIMASINENLPFIQELVSTVMGVVQDVIDTVWPHVQEIVTTVAGAVADFIVEHWPAISNIVTKVMGAIQVIIETVWPIVRTVIETVMGAIQVIIETVWPIISTVVGTAIEAISGAIDGMERLVGVVSGIFNGIKSAIEDPIGTAKRFIEEAMNTIQGIFDGLDFSLPDIALPHFNIWGGEFPYGIGGQGSAPEFSVDWYGTGGFADKPTIPGYGERGLEFYWPSYAPYFDKYAQGIAEHMPTGGGVVITGNTFNVRKDSDIRLVAEELNTLINRQQAGAFA